MIERIRDVGPVLLVPAAWVATLWAVIGELGDDGMLIAHIVMVAFISFFLITGYDKMSTGALRAWRAVMIVGIPVTLAGVAGFVVSSGQKQLFSISLVGWMLLPAAGLAYTARELPAAKVHYGGGAALSVAGAACFLAFLAGAGEMVGIAGIGLVGIGHTMGIVEAHLRNQ